MESIFIKDTIEKSEFTIFKGVEAKKCSRLEYAVPIDNLPGGNSR